MKLLFNQPYLSIAQSDQPVEVSDFAILTGLNGSGKSHLLQSIVHGAVRIDGISGPMGAFIYPAALVKGDEKDAGEATLQKRIGTCWSLFRSVRATLMSAKGNVEEMRNSIERLRVDAQRRPDPNFHEYAPLMHIFEQMEEKFLDATLKDFRQFYPIFVESGNGHSPILNGISDIFWLYYSKMEQNAYNDYRNKKYGRKHSVMSEEQFRDINGPEPWQLLNDLLKNHFNLPYRVNSPQDPAGNGKAPPLDRDDIYHFELLHVEKNIKTNFLSLSSGEQMMMALVASMYKSSFKTSKFPNVLLLDEVDAVLHPSMIQQALDVIQHYFVEKQGMKVLMATHSPSTVAYAPEDSIYIVNPSGKEPRVEKQDKQTALSILTEGVVSCVFDSSARMKIRHRMRTNRKPLLLVEGVTDALIIEEAWKKTREKEIPFDIMEFLGASHLGKNLRNIDDIIRKETGKGGFGLFDHDKAGVSEWGGFQPEKWPVIPAENIRAKKHREHKWHVVLLPVPEQLTGQAGEKYGDKSHMEIEHLFHGLEHSEVTPHFDNEETPGGGEIVIFRGNKRKFAEQVVPLLPKEMFVNFEPLFRFIEEQINLPDNAGE